IFFQAEDGIRDWSVTGVQTCALPISTASRWWKLCPPRYRAPTLAEIRVNSLGRRCRQNHTECARAPRPVANWRVWSQATGHRSQIGRASCRERVEITRVADARKTERG